MESKWGGHTYKRGLWGSVGRKYILWDQIDITCEYSPKGLKVLSLILVKKSMDVFIISYLIAIQGPFSSSAFLFNSLPMVPKGSTDVPAHPAPPSPTAPQAWEPVAGTEDGFHLAYSGSSSFQAEAELFLVWNFPVLNPANVE